MWVVRKRLKAVVRTVLHRLDMIVITVTELMMFYEY